MDFFFQLEISPSTFKSKNSEELLFHLEKNAEEGITTAGNFVNHPYEMGSIELQGYI